MRRINLALFSVFVALLVSLPVIFVDRYLSRADSPWQLKMFNEDSLSSFYKKHYQILGDSALTQYLGDTEKPTVMVLIDGWGVPYDENTLIEDFASFDKHTSICAIHKRAFDITRWAEGEELRFEFQGGLYVSSGDSLKCQRSRNKPNNLFEKELCLADDKNSKMSVVLDSLLAEGKWQKIAWTAHQAREGNRIILHDMLRELSEIAKKYSNFQFIVQGTHRPTLGTPETRRLYLAPWVPAVFVNANTQFTK